LTIIKNGDASTLDVVNRGEAAAGDSEGGTARHGHTHAVSTSRSSCKCDHSVLHEGAIAAGLNRSDDPDLPRLVALHARGHGVNSAIDLDVDRGACRPRPDHQHDDLGGLALAVGILVDDSTVTIENTHRLLEEKVPFDSAVLEGAGFWHSGPTLNLHARHLLRVCLRVLPARRRRYLFTPLAMAVAFAMLASYTIREP